VFSLHVPPDRVVPGEGSRAVGAGDPDALVPLPDVGPQVRLISVRALAEGASQFGTWGQGDLMSLRKNPPKSSPTRFCQN
jgi:hypothetical protein